MKSAKGRLTAIVHTEEGYREIEVATVDDINILNERVDIARASLDDAITAITILNNKICEQDRIIKALCDKFVKIEKDEIKDILKSRGITVDA